ncbi:LamG-like jellyroll fold domain-containing protein, partial [Haloferula sp. BvORR071]|uniref:LamG-like jellyroll fold domain-containing protein n=1 Tax=Haloferula sp. BvORR071 TaxID=1396141 RepID=UPI0005561257
MPETLFVFRKPVYAALALLLALCGHAAAQALDNEKASFATLSGATYTLTGHSELHLTGTGDPIPGCTIHLNSPDSWVFFEGVAPATTVSTLIPRIRVNGANAVTDTNVRVVQYVAGSVVIPQSPSFAALQVFTGQHLSGPSLKVAPYTEHNNTSLGLFADRIRSFVLKRGYTATFAQNENGTGASRNYVAQDGDLEVSLMPADLDKSISFIRVFPWRWTGKKGSCDIDPVALNADWNYNWNISSNSTKDWEYVAIRQQRYWPGLDQDWKARGVNHLSGYNEPDNPVEDAYTTLGNGSTATAVASWPDLLATGLRVGAPAVTDGGYNWIVDFMNKANAAGVRVDYVPVHYYRSYSSASDPAGATTAMYNYLKSIYDATGGRPIWVTEFNNGANWTTGPDPTVDQNRATIEAMINMMDSTPWIERYAVYSDVEWFRRTKYDDGSLTPMGAMYRDHVAPMAHRQVVPNQGSSGNAAYLFEGNVRDTLSGNNPLIYGTPKIVAGKNGSAVSMDGTDDYLALPGRLGDSNDFSFAAWVKWNGGNNWQRIFDLGNGTASYLFLSPKSGGNTLRVAMRLNNGAEQQLNTTPLTAGVWTHVAFTISGDTGKLFVNGSLVNTNTAMTINPSQIGTETNYLGKSQFAADPNFSGLLDDVRFFNTALTDAQVSNLAATTPRAFVASPALAGATVDQPFSADLNTQLSAGAAVTFTKVEGPAWLAVAVDGTVSGLPGVTDIGANEVLVRATTATGGMSIATVQVPVAASSQVVRFGFNSNTTTSVGKMDATLSGGPIYSAGRSGNAIDLDGTDDYVQLPVGIASSPELTVSTWVYWDGGGNWQRIFDFGNGTTSNLFLTPKSGSNTTMFSITHGGVSQNLEGAVVPASTWTHVAVTIGAGTGKLYINGGLAATNATMSLTPADLRPTVNYLGKSQWPDPLYNGRIDDFQVFHRVLSATEINTLRTGTPPGVTINPRSLPAATIGTAYEASLEGAATGTVTYS